MGEREYLRFKAVCLFAATCGFILICLAVLHLLQTTTRTIEQIPVVIQRQSQLLRRDAVNQIRESREDILKEVDKTARLLDRRVASIERKADDHLAETRLMLGAKLDSAIAVADRQLSQANSSIQEVAMIRQDLQPTIEEINNLSGPMLRNGLGLVAALKVTAGETAQTMKHVRLATPEMIAALQESAKSSQAATGYIAQTASNLAVLTKPTPRWVRILTVSGIAAAGAAQISTGIVALKK